MPKPSGPSLTVTRPDGVSPREVVYIVDGVKGSHDARDTGGYRIRHQSFNTDGSPVTEEPIVKGVYWHNPPAKHGDAYFYALGSTSRAELIQGDETLAEVRYDSETLEAAT